MTALGIGCSPVFRRGSTQVLDYPYELSASGLLWLRADDCSNPVAAWPDKYSVFTDIAQGTGTRQPATGTGPNSQAIVDFDGVNTTGDVLISTATCPQNLDAYTLVYVGSRDDNKVYNSPIGIDASPASHGGNEDFGILTNATQFLIGHNRSAGVDQQATVFATAGIPNTATYYAMVITWRAGFTPTTYVNGAQTIAETTNAAWNQIATSGKELTVGIGFDNSTAYHNGKIAELILLNTRLTDLTDMWSYLQTRYALWLSDRTTELCLLSY